MNVFYKLICGVSMCKYCTNGAVNKQIKDAESQGFCLLIEGNKALIYCQALYVEDVQEGENYLEFNYCPMCGKKLEETC